MDQDILIAWGSSFFFSYPLLFFLSFLFFFFLFFFFSFLFFFFSFFFFSFFFFSFVNYLQNEILFTTKNTTRVKNFQSPVDPMKHRVITAFDTFLDNLSLVIHFFSGLLQLNHLIYSSLGIIWLCFHFLQQFHNRDPQRRRKNCLSTIYQLVWGHTN
jgi:hypothetical protein